MKVYYGNRRSSYYIMCTDFKEVYSFDMFGNLEGVVGSIDSCNSWIEVDFISIVGAGNTCEVMYNGYVTEANMSLHECLNIFRNHGCYIGTIFNIPHKDTEGYFNQVLFVYKKGDMVSTTINSKLPNNYWKPFKFE